MTARRRSGEVMDARGVAEKFGRCPAWFYAKREELEAAGFPKKDELLGGWLRAAVQAWLDRRAGVVVASTAEDTLLERAKGWTSPHGTGHA